MDIVAGEPANPHPPENLNESSYRGRPPQYVEVLLTSFKINIVNLKQDVGALRPFFTGRGGWWRALRATRSASPPIFCRRRSGELSASSPRRRASSPPVDLGKPRSTSFYRWQWLGEAPGALPTPAPQAKGGGVVHELQVLVREHTYLAGMASGPSLGEGAGAHKLSSRG